MVKVDVKREGKAAEIRRCKAVEPLMWQPVVNERTGAALWLVLGFLV